MWRSARRRRRKFLGPSVKSAVLTGRQNGGPARARRPRPRRVPPEHRQARGRGPASRGAAPECGLPDGRGVDAGARGTAPLALRRRGRSSSRRRGTARPTRRRPRKPRSQPERRPDAAPEAGSGWTEQPPLPLALFRSPPLLRELTLRAAWPAAHWPSARALLGPQSSFCWLVT